MSNVDSLFQNLRQTGRKAFMPFVTAGDPDLDFTADVIRELDRRGCSMCEVGIPYSDPIADGPVMNPPVPAFTALASALTPFTGSSPKHDANVTNQ